VDLDLFRKVAPLVRPRVITLGTSMTLFPFPVQAMHEIVAEWGGSIFFDGAHQLGLIAGHQYQDPLREGAAVLTGSAGKTFSGPQSGVIVWDDPGLTVPLTHAIFPMLAATHQVNRVAALAVSAAEMLAFGDVYSIWRRSYATPRLWVLPWHGAAFPYLEHTRATQPHSKSSPTCAHLAEGWRWRSDWLRPILSPTRISFRLTESKIGINQEACAWGR
jgi:hypothetical protein